MFYKSAILGCGNRAVWHAKAYEGLEEVKLVAACDIAEEKLAAFSREFGIAGLYQNLEEMLEQERPDILHIATMPNLREGPMQIAADHGVRGIIVEKPIALSPAQAKQVTDVVERTGLKVAVNMQRRYFSTCQALKKVVDDGMLGDVQFIRCVTKGNILSMGPHMVDLLLYLTGDVSPASIWACAYGMNGYDYAHPAPANMMITYTFPSGLVAYCEDSEDAIGTMGEEDFWQQLEIDIWGSNGRAWWAQNRDWGYQAGGMENSIVEPSRWLDSDVPGQREFTKALAKWLDDDSTVHLNCLENALRGFDAILGAMVSVRDGRRIEPPVAVPEDIMQQLEEQLG